jgi:hypothetical protein
MFLFRDIFVPGMTSQQGQERAMKRSKQQRQKQNVVISQQQFAQDPPAGDTPETQPEGHVIFDGERYHYTGFVLCEGRYHPKKVMFTPEEAGVFPDCALDRVCAMLDRVGRDEVRQQEIARFGQRSWHSPYRPEAAALQGLDYIFRHDAELIGLILPTVHLLYATSAAYADQWTERMCQAYARWCTYQESELLQRLMVEGGADYELVETILNLLR